MQYSHEERVVPMVRYIVSNAKCSVVLVPEWFVAIPQVGCQREIRVHLPLGLISQGQHSAPDFDVQGAFREVRSAEGCRQRRPWGEDMRPVGGCLGRRGC